jgi:osmotically-inducible protein OsmY
MKRRQFVSAIALLFPFVATTLAADKPPPNDNYIYDSVREKLAGDAVVKGGAIDLDVKNGVVTLKGTVHDTKQKQKAESLAKKVKGVKSVVNNLVISPL